MFGWFRKKKVERANLIKSEDKTGINQEQKNKDSEDKFNSLTPEERKRRLFKRFLEIMNKLDDLSTQVYHLQQRVEVLEKKTGVNRFD